LENIFSIFVWYYQKNIIIFAQQTSNMRKQTTNMITLEWFSFKSYIGKGHVLCSRN